MHSPELAAGERVGALSSTQDQDSTGSRRAGEQAMMRLARRLAEAMMVAGLALVIGVHGAAAQGSVGIGLWAGIYVPTNNSFSSLGNDIKLNNAAIGGARLTFWGKHPLGLELSGGYSPASVTVAGATVNGDHNTEVFVGALKLMLGQSPASGHAGFYLGVGPAVIRQGVDVLDQGTSQTNWGGVIGVGFHLPLGHTVQVRFDGEDYLYGGDFDGTTSFQNDLVLSAGLTLLL